MSNESNRIIDIGIVVRDPETALTFYRDVLGLEHIDDLARPGEVIRRLRWGNATVKLRCPESPPSASNPGGGSPGGTGIRYLTLAMADVSATLARCVEAGHRVAMPETQTESGLKYAFVEDPEGNWVELLQPKDLD